MKPLCVVSCPIDTFSGYGARSRDFVKSLIQLRDKEWDIKIMPQRWGDTPWNFLSLDDPLRNRYIMSLPQKPDIWFQITIPEEFQPIGTHNIGVTAGIESTILPSSWVEGINRMDLTLISSNHSKHVCDTTGYDRVDNKTKEQTGVLKCTRPVKVLFEGLDLNIYNKKPKTCMDIKLSTILKDIPEDFCFLFTGQWLPGNPGEDRKDIYTLIQTFLENFNGSNNKKPALILKTNSVNNSLLDREGIIQKIQSVKESKHYTSPPNIYLLHGELTDKEMNILNNDPKVKAFVSFTKGEGFGRPLLEQAITGTPIITTNWSGHVDFIKPDYNILIGGELNNIPQSSSNNWLIKESQWFNIDSDIAGRAMKDVFKKYKQYFKKSRKQTQFLKDNFSLDKMTKTLDEYLPKVEAAPQMQELKLPKLKKIEA